METLAAGGEEEAFEVAGGQFLRLPGIFDQVSIPELGKDGLERAAESVQDLDCFLERRHSGTANVTAAVAVVAVAVATVGVAVSVGMVLGVNEEGGAAIAARLEQADALFGGAPAVDDQVVEFIAEELVDHAFVLAADFEEVSEGADWGHAFAQRAGLEQAAHGVGGVAVVADERLQRVAAAGDGCVFAAELIGAGAEGVFFAAPCLQGLAQFGDLGLEALECIGRRLEVEAGLPALHAEGFKLVAGLAHLGVEAVGLAFQSGEALFALGYAVARVAGHGEQMHGVAARQLHLALGAEDIFGGGAGFLLLCLDLLAEGLGFSGGGVEEGALLGALFGDGDPSECGSAPARRQRRRGAPRVR